MPECKKTHPGLCSGPICPDCKCCATWCAATKCGWEDAGGYEPSVPTKTGIRTMQPAKSTKPKTSSRRSTARQPKIPGLGRLPVTETLIELDDPAGSHLEKLLQVQLEEAGVPNPIPEFEFNRSRGWRFDFAWPTLRLAVECEGGIWSQGRHVRAIGFTKDCEKYNAAALMGWTVLRYTDKSIKNGNAKREIAATVAYKSQGAAA